MATTGKAARRRRYHRRRLLTLAELRAKVAEFERSGGPQNTLAAALYEAGLDTLAELDKREADSSPTKRGDDDGEENSI